MKNPPKNFNTHLGAWTIFKRESRRFLRVYLQTILSPVVSNLLYLAIFGLSLNRAIPNVENISYLQFLVPGLIMLGMINNAFQNPSSSIIISKYMGIIGDLLTIPVRRRAILAAFLGAAILRAFIVGTVTLITASFFVTLPFHSIPMILIDAFLVSLIFSAGGFIAGVWAKEFDNIAFLQNFILTPLIFLGGVFYPIQTLPEPFKTISSFNPIVYMIDLLRYGFTGVHAYPVEMSLGIVSATAVFLTLGAYFIMRSGWRLQN